jgi:hypothetical protein
MIYLKIEIVKVIKPGKEEIAIDSKLSANYLADTLSTFRKLVTKEYNQRKYKKKINKLIDYLYKSRVETNEKASIESKL